MPVLPADIMTLFICFAQVFSPGVWRHGPPLVVRAMLARGQRTITAVLLSLGLGQLVTFQTYHRVLNRARWSSRQASQILFRLLVTTFAPHGPLVVGLDETPGRSRWYADCASTNSLPRTAPRAPNRRSCATWCVAGCATGRCTPIASRP
jgi:hypothetical protein